MHINLSDKIVSVEQNLSDKLRVFQNPNLSLLQSLIFNPINIRKLMVFSS
jgi:hypothetical protein